MKLAAVFATSMVFFSASLTFAQAPAAKPHAPKTLRFLNPADVNPAQLLPPPPKDGSPEQGREMAEVKRIIQSRSKERHDQAMWDASQENPDAFLAVISPNLDLAKFPATAKLLADVQSDLDVAAGMAKEHFKRKFPVTAEMPSDYGQWSCDAVDRKPETRPLRSYPSGHATLGYTFGVVLAGMIPDKAEELLSRAASYAYSREVCGDHYRSDVEAGHVLGTTLGVLFLHNEKLKPELDAAKAELKSAGIVH